MAAAIRLIVLISCMLISQKSIAANLWYDSIRVTPTVITKSDSVQIRLYTYTGTQGYQSYLNYNITPGNIWITACYKVNAIATMTWYADTLSVGMLPEGNYKINFLGYVAGDTQCTYIFDSTKVTDSFMVHAPESIHSFGESHISVYPNPASDQVTISLPETWELEQTILQDISGKVVKTTTDRTLAISGLPPGVYILQVQTNKGRFVEKLRKE